VFFTVLPEEEKRNSALGALNLGEGSPSQRGWDSRERAAFSRRLANKIGRGELGGLTRLGRKEGKTQRRGKRKKADRARRQTQ